MGEITRRSFVKGAASAAAASSVLVGTSKTTWAGANDRVRVAVVGIRGQGGEHIREYNELPDVEVATLCDIDERVFEHRLVQHFDEAGLPRPKKETDLRRVLDDPDIDAISVASPNHWHALSGIWACQAGKDSYIEKPCSHNVFEGRKLVEAAEKYGCIVQHGTQIRSNPGVQEAIQHIRDGLLGEVYMARGLCYRMRGDIGTAPDSEVPEGVDYDLWQGPAQEQPFNEKRFHYNWHWVWEYGNGDIGNQGVHQMDIARWGLGVDYPTRVTSMAGMYLWDDAKTIPNTITSCYDFPDAGEKGKMLVFDTRPWHTNDERYAKVGVLFYGEKGYMVIPSYTGYATFLGPNEEPGPSNNASGNHYRNFIDAVKSRDASTLTAPILEGHISSALCHIGLISAKLERSLEFDGENERFKNDDEANALLTRDYRPPFVVPETV